MTKLLIIRHGNTFDPDEEPRRVGVKTDIPLVQSGLDQAAALKTFLARDALKPDAVFASALQRAQQTAKGLTDRAINTDTRFNEIDHGPDENKTETEIAERIGLKALEDWNDYNVVPDGWHVDPRAIQQNWIDFAAECLKDRPGKITAIVSSGGIIRFAPILLPEGVLPDPNTPKVKTGSASLFHHDGGEWRCMFWNKRP